MKVEQISIFIENKSGRLAEVTRVLGEAGINIRTLSLADTSDFGILRLIVDQTDKAQKVLKENAFTVNKTEVVAVQVPDKPNGLSGILQVLDGGKINVEYMYAFVNKTGENAVLIFRFEKMDEAIEVLLKDGFTLISGPQICAL